MTKFYLDDEEHVAEARRLLDAYRAGTLELVAPFPVYYELPSSILKAVRSQRIDSGAARGAIDLFPALRMQTIELDADSLRQIVRGSYDIAVELNRSFYDAIFLATADGVGLPLITADGRLFDAAKSRFDVVKLARFELP